MKKKHWYILSSIAIIYLMSSKKAFANVVSGSQAIRDCDPLGCGYYGAPRGTRKHGGIDVVVKKGDNVLSPITGKITRHGYPYDGDSKYKLIEIVNSTYKVKLMYCEPITPVGTEVVAGQVIAKAQDISEKHGSDMTPHVHVEVYKMQNGKWVLIDPTNLF